MLRTALSDLNRLIFEDTPWPAYENPKCHDGIASALVVTFANDNSNVGR